MRTRGHDLNCAASLLTMAGTDGSKGIRGRFLNIPLQNALACRLVYLGLDVQVFGDENDRVDGLKLIERGDVDVLWNGGREIGEAAPELIDGIHILDPGSRVSTWAGTLRGLLTMSQRWQFRGDPPVRKDPSAQGACTRPCPWSTGGVQQSQNELSCTSCWG